MLKLYGFQKKIYTYIYIRTDTKYNTMDTDSFREVYVVEKKGTKLGVFLMYDLRIYGLSKLC